MADELPGNPPRMTAEEADARFAALVAQHRDEKPARGSRGPRVGAASLSLTWALAIVFAVGVALGAALRTKWIGALLLGIPIVLIARALVRRSGDAS